MLRNLTAIIKSKFTGKLDKEDQSLLDNLEVGDKVDEVSSYAVLLTDLALADGTISSEERSTISSVLARLFPDRAADSEDLINTAISTINNFRTEKIFVAAVKEEYSDEERKRLYDAIEEVIIADGHRNEMELYLRDKFRKLLA